MTTEPAVSTQTPHVKLRAQPAGQLPRQSCFSCPSDRLIRSSSRAQGSPIAHPPSIPTQGWAGDGIYVRSFGDEKKKNHSPHSRNTPSPLCSDCHLLGSKSNSAARSKLNLSLPSFAFYEFGNKLGRGWRKGTKGRWNQDMPTQHGGDRVAERGERTASGVKQGWGWT